MESALKQRLGCYFCFNRRALRVCYLCFQPCGPSSPSSSSLWSPEDPLGSRHRPVLLGEGSGPSGRDRRRLGRRGASRTVGPVRLFYSPALTRIFNFSFTSSVAPTFNNTPRARQKFAPGNRGFDHKTTAGGVPS